MIPVSVSDIVKLLEQIPIWKRLTQLVKEVEDLKSRVAALEQEKLKPPAELCPICETGSLKVIAVAPHKAFGRMGVQERTVKCDNEACGHTEKRMHDPLNRTGKK